MVAGQLVQLPLDLLERQADSLGEDDEGDPAEHGAGVTAVAGAGPLGVDQPPVLVEAQSGGGHPAALRNLADGEQVVDPDRKAAIPLDFKLT